jgi:hypothetical protein
MNAVRASLAALLLLPALALSGCKRTPPPPPQPTLPVALSRAELVAGGDLSALPAERQAQAVQGIATLLAEPVPAGSQPAWAPLRVIEVPAGNVVLTASRVDGTALTVAYTRPGGGVYWRRNLALGRNYRLAEAKAVSRAGINAPLLDLTLAGGDDRAATRLIVALAPDAGLLVRVLDRQGRPVHARATTDHPALAVDRGDLASDDAAQRLAALVRLAQPNQGSERNSAATRSVLEGLAAGSDTWQAALAAELLTQR